LQIEKGVVAACWRGATSAVRDAVVEVQVAGDHESAATLHARLSFRVGVGAILKEQEAADRPGCLVGSSNVGSMSRTRAEKHIAIHVGGQIQLRWRRGSARANRIRGGELIYLSSTRTAGIGTEEGRTIGTGAPRAREVEHD